MRKLFTLALFAAILLVSGCSKEETSLVGTKWVMAWDDAKEIVEFTSETNVRIYEADENLNYSDFLHEGTYSYSNGQITFYDNKLFLADVWGINICYYYYFQTGTIDGDILRVETTCKKLVINDFTTGEHTITDEEGEVYSFMKVQ